MSKRVQCPECGAARDVGHAEHGDLLDCRRCDGTFRLGAGSAIPYDDSPRFSRERDDPRDDTRDEPRYRRDYDEDEPARPLPVGWIAVAVGAIFLCIAGFGVLLWSERSVRSTPAMVAPTAPMMVPPAALQAWPPPNGEDIDIGIEPGIDPAFLNLEDVNPGLGRRIPVTATRGQAFVQQVASDAPPGTATFTVLEGPPGVQVTGTGKLFWKVPANFQVNPDEEILVRVQERGQRGQLRIHAYAVRILEP